MLGSALAGIGATIAGNFLGAKFGDTDWGKSMGGPQAFKEASAAMPTMFGIGGAAEQGKNYRKFLSNAHPNLTDVELARMGSSSAGGYQAQQQVQNAEKMQKRELASRERIAQIQKEGAVLSASMQYGKPGMTSALAAVRDKPFADFDRPVVQAREMLPFQLSKLTAEQQNMIAQRAVIIAQGTIAEGQAAVQSEVAKLAKMMAITRVYQGDGAAQTAARLKQLSDDDKLPPEAAALAAALSVVLGGKGVGAAAKASKKHRGFINRVKQWWTGVKRSVPNRTPVPTRALKGSRKMPTNQTIRFQWRDKMRYRKVPNTGPPIRPGGIRDRAMKARKRRPPKESAWDQGSKWNE